MNTAAPDSTIRWKSISGLGLALLLTYGVLNVVSALVVPIALEARAGMMAMAVAFLGTAWFTGRRGARWAPWVLLVSGVVWVPYYFVIASDFGAFGAKDTFMAALMVSVFAIPAVVGAILMLVAPRGNDRSSVVDV